ncbi:atherin-like [Globicephala melas]|uniref:atherin-like n=1 Tax=Globicephala melas TaxID=9731 RepID=UPI00387371AF
MSGGRRARASGSSGGSSTALRGPGRAAAGRGLRAGDLRAEPRGGASGPAPTRTPPPESPAPRPPWPRARAPRPGGAGGRAPGSVRSGRLPLRAATPGPPPARRCWPRSSHAGPGLAFALRRPAQPEAHAAAGPSPHLPGRASFSRRLLPAHPAPGLLRGGQPPRLAPPPPQPAPGATAQPGNPPE